MKQLMEHSAENILTLYIFSVLFAYYQHIYTKRLIAAIPEVNPNNRLINKEKRLKVEREYKENELDYYDKNGKVYDLKKLSNTHYAALSHDKKGGK